MCSIVLIHRMLPERPLLVGANRDENKDRPAGGPVVKQVGPRRVLAPVDLEAGGTWVGMNDAGVFAGITNRFGSTPHKKSTSRGELPLLALAKSTPHEAMATIAALAPASFNGFHLLLANRDSAWVVYNDTKSIQTQKLDPGVHIVTESSFGAGTQDREHFIRERVAALLENNQMDPHHLKSLLGEKRDPSFFGLCVNVPEIHYATRSATVIQEDAHGKREFIHSLTPPDRPNWQHHEHLLD